MIVQSHREYGPKDPEEGCFAVGKSREEIFKDLEDYCNKHKDYNVFYFVHTVRPAKGIPVPEYMMEIEKIKDYNGFPIMPFWTQKQ